MFSKGDEKMKQFQYDLCVIGGAGHIGLPFALLFAHKGLNVAVYDINQTALDMIRRGIVPFMEEGAQGLLAEALASKRILLSNDPRIVGYSKNIVITIGTPVDEFMNPEFKGIQNAFMTLLPYINNEQLLILRSTVYPGTTEWLAGFLKSMNRSPLISFCPERVVQGKAIAETMHLPQIVSGTTPEAEEAAANFFNLIGVEIVRLSPIEAEFAKLFSNAYRYIIFAIANQFYMICNSSGVDYERVLKGVKHNYPRLEGLTSAGFAAGPCLFKDTMQLNSFAKNEFSLGQAAMNVNEGIVLYIIDCIEAKLDLKITTIGLLGMAFKSDNDDIRSSLSYKMKKLLRFKAKSVLTTDPYVTTDPELIPLETVIDQSDILVLCVPHSQYTHLDTKGKNIIDIWGYLGTGTVIS
jgi:UDP-N-acetyl-D-mannosaminuronic acid dehydrogenase